MPNQITNVAIVCAVAAIAVAGEAAPAQAYACKAYPHQAVGVRAVHALAKIAARQNWESSARSAYGNSWALWSIAKGKSNSCVRLNDGKWRCLASAKPCNFVVP